MADSQTGQTKQDQDVQQGQDQTYRPQPEWDQSFFDQMSQQAGSPGVGGWDFIRPIVDGYHDNAEATLRQARRVTEQYAQFLILQQTRSEIVRSVVPLVTKSVLSEIQRNPSLVKQHLQPQR